MKILTPLVLLPLFSVDAIGQAPGGHWSLTTATGNPPQRRENPGAANATHMYVFGGTSGGSGGTAMNDLWSFDGITWTQLNPDGDPGAPPARRQAGVTWDFASNQLVVFGGLDASGTVLGDTWTWNPATTTWTNTTAPGGPSARRFTAMTFDPANNMVLMFGGLDASGTHLDDTWMLAGGAVWLPQSPATTPTTRRQHHLVTRSDFGDVLLFGGQDASLPSPTKWRVDTLRWDGTDWNAVPTSQGPAGQVANDAAYDPIRQRVVLAGGNGTGGSPTGLISEFDSITNDWIRRPLDPGIYKVSRYFAAYVPALGKTFKASGQNLNPAAPSTSTYEFQSAAIAASASNGSGCTGSAGAMTLVADNEPWGGRDWDLTGSGFSNSGIGFAVLGFTAQSTPLSNFHPAAGAGCSLLVNQVTSLLVLPSGGTASIALALPSSTGFAGLSIHVQMVEIELAGSAISLITSSNAQQGTVGAL
ncbi:MAG: hypothetical protein NXI31_01645 [bacterium]|nr:hypothetical protein [bacterium]